MTGGCYVGSVVRMFRKPECTLRWQSNSHGRPSMYHPGRKEAWLAVVTLVLLAILKLTGAL